MQPMCFSLFGKLKTCWDAGAFVLSPIFSGGFVAPAPAPASLVIFTKCIKTSAHYTMHSVESTAHPTQTRIWEKRTQWCLQNQFEKPYFSATFTVFPLIPLPHLISAMFLTQNLCDFNFFTSCTPWIPLYIFAYCECTTCTKMQTNQNFRLNDKL